ncbi:MAG: sporulation protein Cse60 [Bacteriovoracaceae bacterium]|nr:sporulation protein Cse60 [Bacteriovoracaceae bacterium]
MKIEVFSRNDAAQLQTLVNNFLEELSKKNVKIEDVKFDSVYLEDIQDVNYSAMIIYSE